MGLKDGVLKVAVLHFLFLAGQRLKEGGHINKSLLALGSVIAKLSEGERYGKNNSRFTWELWSFEIRFADGVRWDISRFAR